MERMDEEAAAAWCISVIVPEIAEMRALVQEAFLDAKQQLIGEWVV